MAIPPEPIDEIMSQVDAAVLAEVTQVLERGPQKPFPQPTLPDEVDLPCTVASQVVELRIKEVLFGSLTSADALLKVEKPEGDYALRAGNHGPFLLQAPKGDEHPVIIGRYGPDSYRLDVIQAAIQKHKR